MIRIIEQTHDECVKMYMRCTKKELAEMLANRQELDDARRWVPATEPLRTGGTTWTQPYDACPKDTFLEADRCTTIAYTPNIWG